jgi:hypothetical protein
MSLKRDPNLASELLTPQTSNYGAGFQYAPTAGFPHCDLFDQTLRMRTLYFGKTYTL